MRGDGPTAVKSKVGYLLSGPLKLPVTEPAREHMMALITSSPTAKPALNMPIHVQKHNARVQATEKALLTKTISVRSRDDLDDEGKDECGEEPIDE